MLLLSGFSHLLEFAGHPAALALDPGDTGARYFTFTKGAVGMFYTIIELFVLDVGDFGVYRLRYQYLAEAWDPRE
jgi:hypothetical protein